MHCGKRDSKQTAVRAQLLLPWQSGPVSRLNHMMRELAFAIGCPVRAETEAA